ncbi:hypothetical protein CYMTET_10378 [Cymbomonas tetramitiformis]|uniref:Uncharacterized protein n=1 Tax=Cymbomonas tetramitiformis TaxID=36881 RepID=A0AAE0GPG4_9CHLO|nr:hypothetical protein CYMTET_10378 [Cymbomonas tetramitiformis]
MGAAHRYAHLYHSHYETMCRLDEDAHLNTCFKHFLLFCVEFKLVVKADMAPLKEMISKNGWLQANPTGVRK